MNHRRKLFLGGASGLLCLSSLVMPAYAIKPKTEIAARYLRIKDVERTDSCLRIEVSLKHLPNYWVSIPSSTHLVKEGEPDRQFKIIGSEGFDLDNKVWMPESGHHDGVLLFEPVPTDVKVVDLVETDLSDMINATLGIHLDEADNRTVPKMLTMKELMNGDGNPASWTGFDPARYADMGFYNKVGIAHLKGIIPDYSPRSGITTFTVRTLDDIADHERVHLGNINVDGSFQLDIPLTYPQADYFELGPIRKNIFLVPGDTLSIVASFATRLDPESGLVGEYFGYADSSSDANVINFLTDSLINKRYGLDRLYPIFNVADTDTMKSATFRSNEKLVSLFDSVVSELPVLLGPLSASGFAKDMISVWAIGEISVTMEDLQMRFNRAKGPRYEKGEDGKYSMREGEILDGIKFLAPWMKHKNLIYDNPILVASGMILVNRWKFNPQFMNCGFVAQGMAKIPGAAGYVMSDDVSKTIGEDIFRLDSIGLGNCFVAQLARTVNLIDNLHSVETPSYANLDRIGQLTARIIRHNDYDRLSDILMSEYADFVRDVMIAENAISGIEDTSIVIPETPEGNVLKKIIDPYKGNVLYLDFWGIGCGPCRSGMIKQKALLEELADQPFKALYIANADEGMEECKKWLRKEGIKGEHIFVSGDDWKRLQSLFNFSGIPFGVLVGKDGKVIKTHYDYIYWDDLLLKEALEK